MVFMARGSSFVLCWEWICTNAVHPKVLRGRLLVSVWRCGNCLVRMDKGDWNFRTRLGRRLIKKVAVRIASPHRYLGTFIVNISARATSNKCLFFLSETPFYCGMSTQELWWMIPCCCKYSPRIEWNYHCQFSKWKFLFEIGSESYCENFEKLGMSQIFP